MSESAERISSAIDRIENLSLNTHAKWDELYRVLSSVFGLPEDQLYVTFIGKAANAQVRLAKQIGHKPRLAIGVCGSDDLGSKSYPNQAKRVLSDRPDLEAVVFLFRKGSSPLAWVPQLSYAVPDSGMTDLIRGVWATAEVQTVTAAPSVLRSPDQEATSGGQSSQAQQVISLLRRHHNVVLEGVPGTGKSHLIGGVAENWEDGTRRPLAPPTIVVLHPSSAYEDLVEGLRPSSPSRSEGSPTIGDSAPTPRSAFAAQLGRLADACLRAQLEPESDHLLVLDELNRANVPRVLGEFLLLIEQSRRAELVDGTWAVKVDGVARLTYSGREFFVSDNLYILATMNTSDVSVAALDSALRRRFAFCRLEPLPTDAISAMLGGLGEDARDTLDSLLVMWELVNEGLLRDEIGPDAVLGHSYFFGLHKELQNSVIPRMTGRDFLRFSYLPQLVDILTTNGREDLAEVSQIGGLPETAVEAVEVLHGTLEDFGLRLEVVGSGLGRRIVVRDVVPSGAGEGDPGRSEIIEGGPEEDTERSE